MYLHLEPARKAIEAALVGRIIDPRIAAFLSKDFLAFVKRNESMHLDLVIGHETVLRGNIHQVAWADAPESLRQAVMNGEKMRAVSELLLKNQFKLVHKHLRRYVIHGAGRGVGSVAGHDVQKMAEDYDLAKRRLALKRRERVAQRQMFVIHEEGDHEIVYLAGNAALAVVGTALFNCVRDVYPNSRNTLSLDGGESRHANRMYFGFREKSTGKWTSMGDVFFTKSSFSTNSLNSIKAINLQSNCHEPWKNDAKFWNGVDRALWQRLVRREFNIAIHNAFRSYTDNRARGLSNLLKVLSTTHPLTRYLPQETSKFGVGDLTPTVTSQTVTARMRGGRLPFFTIDDAPFQNIRIRPPGIPEPARMRDQTMWMDLEGGITETFARVYGGLMRDRNFDRNNVIVVDSIPQDAFTENAASATFRRTRNQLQLRGAQRTRAMKDRAIPGLLRGLVTRAA